MRSSAVGVAAHAENFDPIAAVVEADAPVAGAEADLERVDSLELLEVAGIGEDKALVGGEDPQAGGPVERATSALARSAV